MVGYTCVDIDVNPNFGLTSFDNFLYGALLVFRVFTFDQVWPASVRAHVLVWKPARELTACVPSHSIPTIPPTDVAVVASNDMDFRRLVAVCHHLVCLSHRRRPQGKRFLGDSGW